MPFDQKAYDELENQLSGGALGEAAGAAAAPAPPVEPRLQSLAKAYEELDGALEEQEAAKDEQGRVLFESAFARAPDRHAAVLELQRGTKLPVDVVENQFDFVRQRWDASQKNPRQFRQDNPDLWGLLFEQPEKAPVVVKDQEIATASRFIRGVAEYTTDHPLLQIANPNLGAGELLDLEDQMYGREPSKETRTMRVPEPKKNVPYEIDPSAGLEGIERYIGKWRWEPWSEGGDKGGWTQEAPGIFQSAFQNTQAEMDYSKVGFERMALRATKATLDPERVPDAVRALDQRIWDTDRRAAEMSRSLAPKTYNAGPFEQIVLDAVTTGESQYEVLKGGGKAGGAGFVIGLGLGAIARSPTLAKKLAKTGWKIGSKAGAALTSFELESGSFFNDAIGEKLDDGTFVSEDVATGGAIIYGLIATAVEMEAMGHFISMGGPIGEAIKSGEGKAFLRAMMRDAKARSIFEVVGKRWLRGAYAEGQEEFIQQEAQNLIDYAGRSAQAGGFQKADPMASFQEGIDVGVKTFVGTAVIGAPMSALNATQQMMWRDRSIRAGQRVAAIAKLAQEALSNKASPEFVAELIERESQRTGEPITNLYVDANAFVRLFQKEGVNPELAAEQLMGEQGAARLKAALAGENAGPNGQARLEVPLAEYLDKWGAKPVAAALAADTTTRPGLLTTRELIENQQKVREQAQAMADGWLAKPETMPEPASEAEERLVETVEHQLAETVKGTPSLKDVTRSVALIRALLRTQAESFKVSPDVLFDQYVMTVQRAADEKTAGELGLVPAAEPGLKPLSPGRGVPGAADGDFVFWRPSEGAPPVPAADLAAARQARYETAAPARPAPAEPTQAVPAPTAQQAQAAAFDRQVEGALADPQRLFREALAKRSDPIPGKLAALFEKRLSFHETESQKNPEAYRGVSPQTAAQREIYGRQVAWDVPESVEAARLRAEDRRLARFRDALPAEPGAAAAALPARADVEARLRSEGRDWTRVENEDGTVSYWSTTPDGKNQRVDTARAETDSTAAGAGGPEALADIDPRLSQSDVEAVRRNAAPPASTLEAIRAETGAPVREDGTISAGEVAVRLSQTRDAKAWLEAFERNKHVQATYGAEALARLRQGIEMSRVIMQRAIDKGILPEEYEKDEDGSTLSPLRTNQDFGKSFDITTICPRQDTFTATIRDVERKTGKILTPEQRHLVGLMIREHGAQPACWYCYGQAGRDAYDAVISKVTKVAKMYVDLFSTVPKPTPAQVNELFQPSSGEWNWKSEKLRDWFKANWKKLAKDGIPNEVHLRDVARGWAAAETGLEESFGAIARHFAQGATHANDPKGWATLKQQLLRLPDESVVAFNLRAGLRLNSQTDFRPWHVIELSEAIASMRARELAAHVYTKETDFLLVFGKTGIKFNLSAAYVYENGKLKRDARGLPVFDGVIGMAGDQIERWVKELPNDAGGMLVAINDEGLLAGLEDDRVHQIIPYHAGAVPAAVDSFRGARDYTDFQHEHGWVTDKVEVKGKKNPDVYVTVLGKRVKKGTPVPVTVQGKTVEVFAGEPLDASHHLNDQAFYLELCAKLGLTPKFGDLVLANGQKATEHPQYMKLIRDVAREPNKQYVPDPALINWDAAYDVQKRWIASGGDVVSADPKLVKYVLGRIQKNDWPQAAKVPNAEEAAAAREKIREARRARGLPEDALPVVGPRFEQGLRVVQPGETGAMDLAAMTPERAWDAIAYRGADPSTLSDDALLGLLAWNDPNGEWDALRAGPRQQEELRQALAALAKDAGLREVTPDDLEEIAYADAEDYPDAVRKKAKEILDGPAADVAYYENEHGGKPPARADLLDAVRYVVENDMKPAGPANDPTNVTRLYQPAYHGSPHRMIEQFMLDRIGTGQGAQTYGWGLYFAQNKKVAEQYRAELGREQVEVNGKTRGEGPASLGVFTYLEQAVHMGGVDTAEQALTVAKIRALNALSQLEARVRNAASPTTRMRRDVEEQAAVVEALRALKPDAVKITKGQTYVVDVPEADELLDWDKPLGEGSPAVLKKLREAGLIPNWTFGKGEGDLKGYWVYRATLNGKEIAAYSTKDEATAKRWAEEGNANGAQMTGEEIYRMLQRSFPGDERSPAAAEHASKTLLRFGIPGLQYLDEGSRDSARKKKTRNLVIWDESRVTITNRLYAKKAGVERGWVDVIRQGVKKVFKVGMTEQADLSTFLHETGHTMLEMMADLAERPDAPERIKQDFRRALDYLGLADAAAYRELDAEARQILANAARTGRSRDELTDTEKERLAELAAPQEKWARSFEAYLMEGRAPAAALAGAFERFRLWLLDIYRSSDALGVQLNDEIRGVFDRLLATDRELEQMQKAMGIAKPLAPNEFGGTAEQYDAYLKDRAESLAKANRQVAARVAQDRARHAEAWWKEKRAEIVKEAERDFDQRQDARAFAYVKRGEVLTEDGRKVSERAMGRLDRAKVKETGLSLRAIEERLRGRIVKEGGEDPADVAQRFGFKNASEMLLALMQLPDRSDWAEKAADERMAQRYPDILAERDRLAEEAGKALSSDLTSDWLLKEWVALKRQSVTVFNPETGKDTTISSKRLGPEQAAAEVPLEAIREAARIIAGKVKAGQINAGAALRAMGAAGDAAALAAAKGDFAQAYVFKQQQLLNHYLYRELLDGKEAREQFVRLADKMTGQTRRGVLGKFGRPFRDASDLLLEALGLKERETDPDELALRVTMPEALKALEDAGIVPAFDAAKLAEIVARPPQPPKANQAPWQGLTLDELKTVGMALAQLYTAARDANLVMLDGKRVEIGALAGEIRSEAERLPVKQQAPGSDSAAPRRWWSKQRLQGINASLTDPEYMIRLLGPRAYHFFWDGYLDARQAEYELAKAVGEFFAKYWDALPEEMQKRRYDAVDASELEIPADVLRDPGMRDRAWAWMVWLNLGNRSNMERLLGGYGWDEKVVRAWLQKTLTKEEVDFLQGVLDLLDKELWPKVAAQYEKVNGVRPKKIENLPWTMTFADGRTETYRGGYFPARYDPIASRIGKEQSAEEITKQYANAGAVSVARSFTKERVKKFADVINLQWSVVPGHVAQVIHYVAYDSFVRDAARVLLHGDTQAAISRHLGPKYRDQLKGWLVAVSTSANDLVPVELEDQYSLMGEAKSAFVTATLGYSLAVAAGDLTNPLIAIARGQVKAPYMTPSLLAGTNPWSFREMRAHAETLSRELPQRAKNMTQLMRQQLGEVGKQGKRSSVWHAIRESAWVFMEWTDKLTSTIIWDGAFRQGLAEGLSDADAAKQADYIVQRNLPSHHKAEQAAFLRDKRGLGAITAFYGYFSKLYNANREIWHDPYVAWSDASTAGEAAVATGKTARAAGRMLAVFFVSSVLAEMLSGRGPEDDEEYAEWILRKMLSSPFTLLPIIGAASEEGAARLSSLAFHGKAKHRQFSMRASPAAAAVERVGRALLKALDHKRDADQRFWDVLEVAAVGVPGFTPNIGPLGSNQITRTGRYVTSGNAVKDAENGRYLELLAGLVYGERKDQPANPGTALQKLVGR